MPQIGDLTTGAGVNTSLNQDFLPQYLQVGNVDDANPLQALRVATKGKELMNISNQARIQALGALDMEASIAAGASVIPNGSIRLADGQIEERTQMTLQNSGVPAPVVYGNSLGFSAGAVARFAIESSINASQNQTYRNFEYLLFLPANVTSVDVTYSNGYKENLTVPELEALFLRNFNTQANALVNGHLVIAGNANPFGEIVEAKIYNGSGGSTTVLNTFNESI